MPEDEPLPSDEDARCGSRDWPHAPPHRLAEAGVYFVTARCTEQRHLLHTPERRDWFLCTLFALSEKYGWPLLTRLDIDETQTIDLLDVPTPVSERFSGTSIQDTLNGLLIEDYDPDEGDASVTFSLLNVTVTEGVAL